MNQPSVALRASLGLLYLVLAAGRADGQWRHLGGVTGVEVGRQTLTLACDSARLQLTAVSDHVLRVRLSPSGTFERDFSWAIENLAPTGTVTGVQETPESIAFSIGSLSVDIRRDPCRLTIRDRDGAALVEDDPRRGMAWEPDGPGGAAVRVWQRLPPERAIHGLGEKTGGLNKRDGAWTMWNTDRFVGLYSDPLYQSIPFFMAADGERYFGIFFDNPRRSAFDFGKSDADMLSFGAAGGELNYYVIAGPHPKDVVTRYTALTGRLELPPRWAIGYHQCRYSYYPESRVREIARSFRQKRIPCDVIYFDIDYMDGYRCFTWSPRYFPDPAGLMRDLKHDGFHTVTIVDPGIKLDPGYATYDEGTRRDVWVKTADGQPYVGRVWPGESVYPDFTDPAARAWWAEQLAAWVKASGVDGIWNDMNEPSDFSRPENTLPLDCQHDNEGQPAAHADVHNVYGMQMHRASRDGLLKARPNERPFAMTRATYAGGQRFGAAWTGDNYSEWAQLPLSISMVLGMGVSGLPFVGPDIGGFAGGATPEMYARWIQFGSLLPYSRTHTSWNNPDQEPWSFGPVVEKVARESLNRRYELLPYLYTLFEECSRTGLPIARPIWMEFPGYRGWFANRAFLLGRELLVAPIVKPGAASESLWLPPGVWFDRRSGLVWAAGQPVPIDGALDTLPLFVRGGAILPTQSVVQHTGETPTEPLILECWPFGMSEGELYEDDGATFLYRQGAFRRTKLRCSASDNLIDITMHAAEGTYQPKSRTPKVLLRGLTREVVAARCAEGAAFPAETMEMNAVPYQRASDGRGWLISMRPDDGRAQTLRVTLGAPSGRREPISLDFDAPKSGVAFHHECMPPRYGDGEAALEVRSPFGPYVVLPRTRIDCAALPMMKLRLATEHCRQLVVRFASEDEPTRLDSPAVRIDLQADGEMHEYEVDLTKASPAWTGVVYLVRLDFGEGTQRGEVVRLDRVRFDRSGH